MLHIDDMVMANAIQLVCGDAGPDMWLDHPQDFGGEPSRDAHLFDLFRGLDMYRHAVSCRVANIKVERRFVLGAEIWYKIARSECNHFLIYMVRDF